MNFIDGARCAQLTVAFMSCLVLATKTTYRLLLSPSLLQIDKTIEIFNL